MRGIISKVKLIDITDPGVPAVCNVNHPGH